MACSARPRNCPTSGHAARPGAEYQHDRQRTVPSPVIPGAPFAHRSAVPISAGTEQMTTSVVVGYQMKG